VLPVVFLDESMQKVSMWSVSETAWFMVKKRHKREEKQKIGESFLVVSMFLLVFVLEIMR
jgi:phosphoglycerate-specific signal transduction histidine kinase